MSSERLQKILAQAGIASRRKAEELIQEGLVTVNGKVAKIGDKAEFGKDSIKVKGKLLISTEPLVYLALNKPRGVISMLSDPEGRPTLADYLAKVKTRVFPVGRLDFTSEGLILLTNDGALAEKLQRRDDVARVYIVKVKGHSDSEMIARIQRGARLGEGKKRLTKPHSVRITQRLTNKTMIEVVMLGAGAFDIKTLFESRGFLVEKITRTAIGHITLKGLEFGEFRYLKPSQVAALLEQPELGMKRIEEEAEDARPISEPTPFQKYAKPSNSVGSSKAPKSSKNESSRPQVITRSKSGVRSDSRTDFRTQGRSTSRTEGRSASRTEGRSAPRAEGRSPSPGPRSNRVSSSTRVVRPTSPASSRTSQRSDSESRTRDRGTSRPPRSSKPFRR